MTPRHVAVLGLIFLSLASLGTAQTMYDADVNVNMSETDLEIGDMLTMTVSLEGFDEDNYSYQFLFGGDPVNSTETSLEHEVNGRETIGVRVINGSEIIAEGTPSQWRISSPDDMVEIEVPDSVEPGETFNATANILHDIYDDYEYNWESSEVISDGFGVEINQTGPTVTVTARDDGEAPEDAHLEVEVKYGDDYHLDRAEGQINWDLYQPDVEGLDATYEEGSVELDISESRLEEGAEVRMGSSLKGWSQVQIGNRRSGGGTTMTFEQVENDELDPPENIVLYSTVDIGGQNLQGLQVFPSSAIETDWLEEHDLLVTDDQAHVSYYLVEDGEWERLPSETGYSDLEDHIGLDVAFEEAYEQDAYVLDGEARIAIAGDTEGLDLGRFAVGPEGQCERLEEGAPVPMGWEEIDVSCDVHDDAQNVREQLDRLLDEIEEREQRESAFETPEEIEEEIDSIEEKIDEYKVREAEQDIEDLEKRLRESFERQGRMQHLQSRFERNVQNMERIPEEYRDQYERPDEVKELIEEYQTHVDEGNVTAAEATLNEIMQKEEQARERVHRMADLDREIQQARQRDLNEDQQQRIDEAEELLDQGNVTAAEQRVQSVRQDFQRSEMRGMIESIVRSVLSDILGIDLGGGETTQENQPDSADQSEPQLSQEPREEQRQEREQMEDQADGEGSQAEGRVRPGEQP